MTGTHPARSVRHKTGAWLRRVLEDSKAEVMTASCAAEALHMIAVRRPDLLVSDIGCLKWTAFPSCVRYVSLIPSEVEIWPPLR